MKPRTASLVQGTFWLATLYSVATALPSFAQVLSPEEAVNKKAEPISQYVPGDGFDVANGKLGSLNISAYILLRYLNQLPANQSFVDHLGNSHGIDARNDIQLHRVLIHFDGFLFNERFRYDTTIWGVNSTNSVATIGNFNYKFSEALILGGGIGAMPGTRSLNYEHPFFLGTDRQMADEYFRPSFTSGVWVSGKPIKELHYRVMLGDSINIVNINAAQLTRDFALGGTVAWMPTTGEFGPKGGFGDFEDHPDLATRFGFSFCHSREDRFSEIANPNPDNTTIRLSDSIALFQAGSLAQTSTIQKADFTLLALDASIKFRGFFLFGEFYQRHLGNFEIVGVTPPQSTINDTGFMFQSSHMVAPQRWELYGAFSQIFGEFNQATELTLGSNYYPFRSRSLRLNTSLTYVNRSPVSSLFGYFVGGEHGPIISASTDMTF